MKRWNLKAQDSVEESKEVAAFLAEYEAICRKYKMMLDLESPMVVDLKEEILRYDVNNANDYTS